MSATPRRTLFTDAVTAAAVAALYIGFAKLGLALAFRAEQVSAVWPPTGFAIGAVVLLGRRAILGVLVGAFAANATANEPSWVAMGIAAGNTLEAVVAAVILRRLRFDAALARITDVVAILVAVAAAPLVSATIGVAFLAAGGVHSLSAAPALWPVWWLGDVLGGLIVAPLILVWSRRDRLWNVRGFVEPALMIAGLVSTAAVVFFSPQRYALAYAVYPFLIWSALRLGPAYTTTASLLANAVAVAGTLAGKGPFAGSGPEGGLVLVQIFIAVGATTALMLGAVAAQSHFAHARAELGEQRLRMTMAAARVGVWEWNILTDEITWSEALEPLHGLPRGGFAGTFDAYLKTIHPDDLQRVKGLIQTSIDTGAPYEAEFRLLGRDGVVRWTSPRGVVHYDTQGRAVRMTGVGIDVTEQKQLEEELRMQHRRKDEFLAMLGHELRNPLSAVVHAVDLLSSTDAAERENATRVIRRQASNLSRLVDDLLDVSRITRGRIALETGRLALAEVVEGGVEVWRHFIAQKKQQTRVDVAAGTWVDGDATRLTQVVANLVHNASKFTREGGLIAISAAAENGSAVLRVRDNGEGMTQEMLAHAFELFVQGAPTLDRNQGGLGLGLTLVRGLVEMHGGTVEAISGGPGTGTEVAVRLPLAQAPAKTDGAPASEAADRSAVTARRRVLVVEDNPDARQMLVFLLKRAGHDVRAAEDGYTALGAAAAFAPEVVLLDVGLPGLDGYAVARRLRTSPATADALLVALTGYGQASDRDKALAAGFDHHLLKPSDSARVLEIVQKTRALRQ